MGVTVRAPSTRLADLPLTTRALMKDVGLLARERIVRRTLSGRDMNDAAFRPYSSRYVVQKEKAYGIASPVNLQASGAMLGALTIINLTDTSVTLGFTF